MAAEAWLAQDEQEAVARRSRMSTAPSEPPSAPQVWLSDMPSWCVDLGPTLRAMSACELWLSIARGDVTAETKVWREGMAYWEPAGRVPEFALALPEVSAWSSRRPAELAEYRPSSALDAPASAAYGAVRHDVSPDPASEEGDALERAHAAADPRGAEEAVRVVTLVAPGDFATPAPVVVEQEEPPPVSAARPRTRWLDRRAAASVTAGAAIAITALALATTGPSPASEPTRTGARPAAAAGPETLLFGEASPARPRSVEDPSPAWSAPPREPAIDARDVRAGASAGRPANMTGERGAPEGAEEAPSSGGVKEQASAGAGGGRPAAAPPVKVRAPRGPRAADRGQRRAR